MRAIVCLLFLISIVSCFRTYDYIIAGGGTAGSVLAGRLSENPSVTVLLIERGQNVTNDPTAAVPTINAVIPPYDLSLLPTEHFHSYEPGMSSGHSPMVVPFALGGGPAISGSFWGRGDPSNYNEWADLVGDNRLRYENLLPFFKKSENVDPNQSNSTDRGRTGPMQITVLDPDDPYIAPYVTTQCQVFNITYKRDYCTSDGVYGVWPMQRSLVRDPVHCNASTGPCTRSTSFRGYVEPHLDRPNLEVVDQATVINLNFKRTSQPEVNGLTFLVDGETVQVRARKEVIVSLGTFGSAKLLLRSGIGNSNQLQQVGIDVVKHLPGVGQNLRDHNWITMAYYLPSAASITDPSSVRITFLKSGYHGDFNDIELAWGLVPTSLLLPAGTPGAILLLRNVQVREAAGPGNVALRSQNPFERMDSTFAFTPSRLPAMVWAFKKIRQWMSVSGGVELAPGTSSVAANATDAAISAYISKAGAAWYHVAGTCKMGSSNDPNAVVDSDFKVFGVKNLRVVDNSVQPVEVCTHPSATAIVLAEVAATRILADCN